jgi:hypothetical protein
MDLTVSVCTAGKGKKTEEGSQAPAVINRYYTPSFYWTWWGIFMSSWPKYVFERYNHTNMRAARDEERRHGKGSRAVGAGVGVCEQRRRSVACPAWSPAWPVRPPQPKRARLTPRLPSGFQLHVRLSNGTVRYYLCVVCRPTRRCLARSAPEQRKQKEPARSCLRLQREWHRSKYSNQI